MSEFMCKKNMEEGKGILIPLGMDDNGAYETVSLNLNNIRHVMATGTLGSGRVEFLRAAITSILLSRTPDQVKLWLCDGGTLGLDIFNGKESPFFSYTSFGGSPEEIRMFVSALSTEVDLRIKRLAEGNRASWSELEVDEIGTCRIVAVMDVSGANMKALSMDNIFCEQFSHIVIQAASVGVHFIMSGYDYDSMSHLTASVSDLFDVQVAMLQIPSRWHPNSVDSDFVRLLKTIKRRDVVVNYPTPHILKKIYIPSEKIINVLSGNSL